MAQQNLKDVPLDDIIFEGLHKEYGAYVLRKIYGKHITNALIFSTLVFSLALIGPQLYSKYAPKDVEVAKEVVIDMAQLPPPPPEDPAAPPPPPPPPPPPQVSTIRFVPPEPVPDAEVPDNEEPPPVEEVKQSVIAATTVEGDPDAVEVVDEPREETKVVEIQKEEIFTVVEQAPAYPGGMAELGKYLSRNLKYPRQASQNNIEGTVYAQFVVDSHGKISDVKILKGIGYGCDEEAERVVKAMPAWNPGKQGGRGVSVRFSLPIKFKLAQ